MKCRLCGHDTVACLTTTILGQFPAEFHRCGLCGLVQVVDPHWLDQKFDLAISATDTGMVQRNIVARRIAAVIFTLAGQRRGLFVDYGGGYGLFTRLMRDIGFDFRLYDPYSENLIARGFEYQPGGSVAGVVLQEVLEHLREPTRVFDEVFNQIKPNIVFATTCIYPQPIPADWWYLSRETGQHVAFYSRTTFEYLAQKYGYRYTYWGDMHVLAKIPVSPTMIRLGIMMHPVFYPFCRNKSLTLSDCALMLEKLRNR